MSKVKHIRYSLLHKLKLRLHVKSIFPELKYEEKVKLWGCSAEKKKIVDSLKKNITILFWLHECNK